MDATAPGRKTLLLMRHAAAARPWDVPDRERPLSHRGRDDAAAQGAHLARYRFDLVACSPATRTRQTWEAAVAAGAVADRLIFPDDLYGASVWHLVTLVETLDEAVGTALVIGHNPGISQTAQALVSPGPLSGAAFGFVTAAIAVLTYDGPWADAPGAMTLERYQPPD